MIANVCPDRDRLLDYLRGSLPAAEVDSLDDHVNACPECQSAVDTLDDALVPDLGLLTHVSAEGQGHGDPLLERLLSRAKGIAVGDSGLGHQRADLATTVAAPGQVLGQYELLEPIGRGGMGTVFKAYHRRMRRTVALKLLSPGVFHSQEQRDRFDREIEAAARLTHPNIVTAHDAGDSEGRAFLVMEYVEGSDLARRVQEDGPLAWSAAVAVVRDAARGLAHAHAAGIIHRDVKPANLLRDADGNVKVSDLGLARLLIPDERNSDPALTSQNGVMGTAAYMAPEQALSPQQADYRADIYSLGCTLYFLLTGRPPFAGESTFEMLYAHRDQPIPSVREHRPECPPELDAVLRKMLAKQPKDRFASMEEVVRALERIPLTNLPATLHRRRWVNRWLVAGAAAASFLLMTLTLMASGVFGPGADVDQHAGGTEQPADPGKSGGAGDGKQPVVPPAPGTQTQKPRAPEIELVRIEAGDFLMGASSTDDRAHKDEKPQHNVKITRPFYLGKYTVTQEQYREVMGVNPSSFSAKGTRKNKVSGIDTSKYPVEGVSWEDAIKFCNRLSEMHDLPLFYKINEDRSVKVVGGAGYRLPTEAEWEFACRGGTKAGWLWSFGNDATEIDKYAWYAKNSNESTHPVGTKLPNPFGLYDMHGNILQWCWDRYDAEYYKSEKLIDPTGPPFGLKDIRLARGGSFDVDLGKTRSSARTPIGVATYGVEYTLVGIRVAKNLE